MIQQATQTNFESQIDMPQEEVKNSTDISQVHWQASKKIEFNEYQISVDPRLSASSLQEHGIRKDSKLVKLLKNIFWYPKKLHDDLFVDGFIERKLGELIKKHYEPNTSMIEIGCGDMSLSRYFPANTYYNALEISFSGFHLSRNLRKNAKLNPIVASAERIPAKNKSVSFILTSETLTNIPDIKSTMREIRRIAADDAKFVVSIPNEKSYKYQCKGDNPHMIHQWDYEEFVSIAKEHGFELVEGFQMGYWIPLPSWLWLKRVSYHLPIRCRKEEQNVNFFFVFKRING